ncbi:MAG: hypothetical protein JO356_02135 [Acidobacteria bacterium]|nr:hypothetical protein [Acidobacteriota bacterium]
MSKIYLGRYIYGVAAIISGVITFAWRDLNAWREIMPLDKVPHSQIFLYIAAAIELFGGLALLWAATRRTGALFLGIIYLIFALLSLPHIAKGGWVNFFEEFALVSGALVVLGETSSKSHQRARGLARIGYIFFGICVISFTAAQVVYFSITKNLVPKWILPAQSFWAIATTVAFGLAAVALLSGRCALLACRLLTIMLVGFGLLVWLPIVLLDSHKLFNWTENVENLAIAGAAWIVADFLAQNRAGAAPVP